MKKPTPDKPPPRTPASYEREIQALTTLSAGLQEDVKKLHAELVQEKAGRLRELAASLGKYAQYDAELALLRKLASQEMGKRADELDPPKAPAGKPG